MFMNWFKRHQEVKIAQGIANMQAALSQISQLADQIAIGLSQTKKHPEIQKHWQDPNLNSLFNRCDQTAKSVIRNLQAKNIPSAAAQIEQGLLFLDQICQRIDCMTTPVWRKIRE